MFLHCCKALTLRRTPFDPHLTTFIHMKGNFLSLFEDQRDLQDGSCPTCLSLRCNSCLHWSLGRLTECYWKRCLFSIFTENSSCSVLKSLSFMIWFDKSSLLRRACHIMILFSYLSFLLHICHFLFPFFPPDIFPFVRSTRSERNCWNFVFNMVSKTKPEKNHVLNYMSW